MSQVLRHVVDSITPASQAYAAIARAKISAMPLLERLAGSLAGAQHTPRPRAGKRTIVVALGDHGAGGESSHSARVSCAAAARFTLRHPVAGCDCDDAMHQFSPPPGKPLRRLTLPPLHGPLEVLELDLPHRPMLIDARSTRSQP